MYSLAMVLVLLGILAFSKAMRHPPRGRSAAVALVTAALLYTTYWSFFVLGVVGAVLIVWAIRAQRGRTRHRDPADRCGVGRLRVVRPVAPDLPHAAPAHGDAVESRSEADRVRHNGHAVRRRELLGRPRAGTVLLAATALIALSGWAIPKVSRSGRPPPGPAACGSRSRSAPRRCFVGVGNAMLTERRVPGSVCGGGVPVRRAGRRIRAARAAGSRRGRVGDRCVRSRRGAALDHDGAHGFRGCRVDDQRARHTPGTSWCIAPIRSAPRPPASFANRSGCAS